MDEYELDEFEAMEAEAEALASQNNPKTPKASIRPAGPPSPPPIKPAMQNTNAPRLPMGRPPVQQQQQSRPQPRPAAQEETEEQPLWIAYHQPESVGVVNTQTGERIEGFKDEGVAQSMARILSDLNTVIVSGGYE
jgi:hypothetical protein